MLCEAPPEVVTDAELHTFLADYLERRVEARDQELGGGDEATVMERESTKMKDAEEGEEEVEAGSSRGGGEQGALVLHCATDSGLTEIEGGAYCGKLYLVNCCSDT